LFAIAEVFCYFRIVIRFDFNSIKSTQAAAHILKRAGGQMSKYILLKMIYLADRLALEKWCAPITGDEPHSMQYGPVPSRIYDFTKGSIRGASLWMKTIETRGSTLVLKSDPGRDDLSDSEIELIDSIYEQFKDFSFGAMRTYCHELPEYDGDVGKGARPIRIETLLRDLGKTNDQIEHVEKMCQEEAVLNAIFRA
jgi:uncharacterized phage-associated protein